MNKPKLDLQVNTSATITLMQDKPVTGKNAYGDWYLFGVESEGQEYSFFANDEVSNFVSENKLGKGDAIKITKIISKNGKKNQTGYQMEIISRAKHNGNGQSNGNGRTKEDYDVMHDSLTQGIQLQKDLGSVIDVNRIAITLFITRTKQKNGYYNL
jgi:hypothetical protein